MESFKLDYLSQDEMENVNGGIWHYVVGALIGAALSADLDGIAGAAKDGWNAA